MSEDYPVIFSKKGLSTKKKGKQGDNDKIMLAKSLNIGYYLITPLLAGVFFGYWMDRFFGTKPAFMLLLLGLGIAGAFYNLWKTIDTYAGDKH